MNEIVMKAREFAIRAHNKQRYGDLPYVYHLDQVYAVLSRFEYWDEMLLAAAYLHDVVEDTSVRIIDIDCEFGIRVGSLVLAVTDMPGATRNEQKASTYPMIKASGEFAIVLKLADRIANMEASGNSRDTRREMYRKEYPEFREALFGTEAQAMWTYLDGLMGWRPRVPYPNDAEPKPGRIAELETECERLRGELSKWLGLGAETPAGLALLMEIGIENYKKLSACSMCAGDPRENEPDKDCICGGARTRQAEIAGLKTGIAYWLEKAEAHK